MRVHVLGAGAGGGFPQWNCNCSNCSRMRRGEINARARTQSSIAVSGNGIDWVLINASPDIRAQLAAFPKMQPARGLRDTAICAIVLIDSQIDHTAGLLTLRENANPLDIYSTERVRQDLTSGFPVLSLLEHYCGVRWHELLENDHPTFSIPQAPGLVFTAVNLKSEAPPYSPHRHNTQPGDNIGIRIEDSSSGKNLFYAPGLGDLEPQVLGHLGEADCLLVDGTFWTEDEMSRAGVGVKPASAMGHLPQSGDQGMLRILEPLERPRKILIHINNTNPILDEDSPQHAELERAGVEVAFDGMDLEL